MGRILYILVVILVFMLGYRWVGPERESQPQTAATVQEEGWQEYSSDEGLFRVELPAEPEQGSYKLPIPNTDYFLHYEMFTSEDPQGSTYMISLVKYPNALNEAQAQRIMKDVMNQMVQGNPENRLVSETPTQFDGYTAVDFVIENPDVILHNKAFYLSSRLYLLSLIHEKGLADQADFIRFVNSFRLEEKPMEAP